MSNLRIDHEAVCGKCGHTGWHWRAPGKGPHWATLLCGHCLRWLRFLPHPDPKPDRHPSNWEYHHPARARMRDLPPSEAQLELIGRSEWRWLAPHLRDRDMASRLIGWIVAEAEA